MTQPLCIVCGDLAYEASVVGVLCRDCADHVEPRCDFCSDLDPCWRYPAKSFLLPSDDEDDLLVGSREDWLACDVCHELIEAGNRRALAERTLESGVRLEGGGAINSMSRILRLLTIVTLQDLFRANRLGAAIRRGSA